MVSISSSAADSRRADDDEGGGTGGAANGITGSVCGAGGAAEYSGVAAGAGIAGGD
jgi:hypothetical protein